MADKKKITILVPCYNEEAVLKEFYGRVSSVISDIKSGDFSIFFVNDGSSDRTLEIMKDLNKKDKRVHYLDLSRNYGKEIAVIAGIDYIDADAMILIDADLQDPPELIEKMIEYWQQGYDDIAAKRKSRAGETFFKKWSSHMYYRILQSVTRISIQTDVGDFRLLSRQCIEALKSMREFERYNKGLCSWIGFNKKEILYDRDARFAGETKWNYFKLFNLAIDGITSFTIVPLRLATIMGLFTALAAVIYMCVIVIKTILGIGHTVPGYPSLISAILFIGGVQLFCMGIMGEYIGRIFTESKGRPLYFAKEMDGKKIIDYTMIKNS
ncbi:glycosyltransferase family 2 protein [Pectinatus brassicae]|uniref:Glycosyltransferase involved in cell wall biosynthesis n=1 Tax=Pectinatus brassicae TaxID=862415 RepID=A0A840UI61_9FIRM|nr:glycosyltransferase family 2 protein [Pectinatus brassicae]MBB5336806.1 glycosyltransferase involved in cell wall biosynthesis [Pectinatus brassicae]